MDFYGSQYFVRIPLEIYGKDKLMDVLAAVRGMDGAMAKLTATQKEFVRDLRDEVNILGSLDKALKSIITGATGASDTHRMMAMGIRALNADLALTQQAADRAAQAMGRIGGRVMGAEVLGRMMGIPGGGFIGSQFMGSMQGVLPPWAMVGMGGVAAVGVAGIAAGRTAYTQSRYAQEQYNLAKQYGTNPQEMQLLGHVASVTDTNFTGLLSTLKAMNKTLGEGGEQSAKVRAALADLGLTTGLAFEQPKKQIEDVITALRGVGNESERERLAVKLLGESGRSLLPLVDQFNAVADAVKQSGVIIDRDGIDRLVKFRHEVKDLELAWESLKNKMAGGIVAALNLVFNDNAGKWLLPTLGGAGGGAVVGGIGGFMMGGPLGALIGAGVGSAVTGGVVAAGGYMDTHYGMPNSPSLPQPNIPSGMGLMQDSRLKEVDALEPEGRTRIEQLRKDLEKLDAKIKTAREKYISGGGRVGYTIKGDPEKVRNLDTQLQNLVATQKYYEDAGMSAQAQDARNQQVPIIRKLNELRTVVPYFNGGDAPTIEQIRGMYHQRLGIQNQIKSQEQYDSQLRSFQNLPDLQDMSPQQLAAEGRMLSRMHLLTGYGPYKNRVSAVRGAQSQVLQGGFADFTEDNFAAMLSQLAREGKQTDVDREKYFRGELRDATSAGRESNVTAMAAARGLSRDALLKVAVAQGYDRYGMTPNQLASNSLNASLYGIRAEYGGRTQGLQGEIDALTTQSVRYGNLVNDTQAGQEAARRQAEVDSQIDAKRIELENAKTDATHKAVEAINRFNESITKSAEQVRSEFAGGFASVIGGALHGKAGVLGALRGFGERQLGGFLTNIGEHVWDGGLGDKMGKIGAGLPDWLTKGTIFGHQNQPIELNTSAIEKNVTATNRLADLIQGMAGGRGIPKYADGGLVTSPQLAMIGEDGPEMVLPLRRNKFDNMLRGPAGDAVGGYWGLSGLLREINPAALKYIEKMLGDPGLQMLPGPMALELGGIHALRNATTPSSIHEVINARNTLSHATPANKLATILKSGLLPSMNSGDGETAISFSRAMTNAFTEMNMEISSAGDRYRNSYSGFMSKTDGKMVSLVMDADGVRTTPIDELLPGYDRNNNWVTNRSNYPRKNQTRRIAFLPDDTRGLSNDQLIDSLVSKDVVYQGINHAEERAYSPVGSDKIKRVAITQKSLANLYGKYKAKSIPDLIDKLSAKFPGVVFDYIGSADNLTKYRLLYPYFPEGMNIPMDVGSAGLPKFGDGGIVTGPTQAIVGEKGPEAIIPLSKLTGDKAYTEALDRNTSALNRIAAALGVGGYSSAQGGAAGMGGYSPVGGGGYTPESSTAGSGTGAAGVADEITGIAQAATILSGVTHGSSKQQLAAVAGTMGKLGSVLKGTKYSGNFGKIFSGSLKTGEEVGAIAGTVGLGLAAYGGISTMAQGGAKNVTGGLSMTLGAIAPMTGPAAPFVATAAALAGMVSAFLPDPRVQRQQEMSQRMFAQQYKAPEAIHLSMSGAGSYSDFDAYGGIRSSHFSPYPIVSNTYLDVPRRTVVPGHEISSFGGYQNATGARTPLVINYNTMHVSAMDSKSFVDNAHNIMNAINRGLSDNYHPLVNTLRKQIGGARG